MEWDFAFDKAVIVRLAQDEIVLFKLRAKCFSSEVEQEWRVLYGGKPCEAGACVRTGSDQQIELTTTQGLEAGTEFTLHALGTGGGPALKFVGGENAFLGFLP